MHPILIEIGDFFIGTYGLMIALGLMAAIWLASIRGKPRGFDPNVFFDLAFVAIISGFVAARITYIALNPAEFAADPMGLIFSRSGFVFLGGFIGAVAAIIGFMKWKGLPILATGDVLVPSLAIGHAFGRIGCHLAGCCWGGVCTVPGVGVRVGYHEMPDGTPFGNAFTDQFYRGIIDADMMQSLPIWPVQLMESIGLFLLAGALVWWASRGPLRPGFVIAGYLIIYGVMRFMLEFLRGDAERGLWFGGTISTSQIISALIIPVGIALIVANRKKSPSPHSHPSLAKGLQLIPAPKDAKPK